MLIYLDNCCLQRPFDDRSQQRIRVEAEATLALVELAENGVLELISSDALVYEVGKAPDSVRREFAQAVLEHAVAFVELSSEVERLAATFVEEGVSALDALHLASAVRAEARYFCTTDDRLLRQARRLQLEETEAVSLLHLIEEVSHASEG